jgi:hypothetical protein
MPIVLERQVSSSRLPARVAVLLIALLMAACGGSPATPSPPDIEQTTPLTLLTPHASNDAVPTPGVPSSDRELEAVLPDTFEGEALQKFSFSGTDAVRGDSTTLAIIAAAGRSVGDFSIAGAVGQTSGAAFMAMRLKGADASMIQRLFEQSAHQSGDEVEQVSLGGQRVYRVSGPTRIGAIYFVIEGDTAVAVTATDDASAVIGLASLP